jgi:hypothetical protein
MSNMGYCRWRNTANDLSDCLDSFENGDSICSAEANSAVLMFREVLDYFFDNGVINEAPDDGAYDEIDRLIMSMTEKEED